MVDLVVFVALFAYFAWDRRNSAAHAAELEARNRLLVDRLLLEQSRPPVPPTRAANPVALVPSAAESEPEGWSQVGMVVGEV